MDPNVNISLYWLGSCYMHLSRYWNIPSVCFVSEVGLVWPSGSASNANLTLTCSKAAILAPLNLPYQCTPVISFANWLPPACPHWPINLQRCFSFIVLLETKHATCTGFSLKHLLFFLFEAVISCVCLFEQWIYVTCHKISDFLIAQAFFGASEKRMLITNFLKKERQKKRRLQWGTYTVSKRGQISGGLSFFIKALTFIFLLKLVY